MVSVSAAKIQSVTFGRNGTNRGGASALGSTCERTVIMGGRFCHPKRGKSRVNDVYTTSIGDIIVQILDGSNYCYTNNVQRKGTSDERER